MAYAQKNKPLKEKKTFEVEGTKTDFGEKVLAQGQMDDLISDTGKIRVWRSREDNSISIEEYHEGRWILKKDGI